MMERAMTKPIRGKVVCESVKSGTFTFAVSTALASVMAFPKASASATNTRMSRPSWMADRPGPDSWHAPADTCPGDTSARNGLPGTGLPPASTTTSCAPAVDTVYAACARVHAWRSGQSSQLYLP